MIRGHAAGRASFRHTRSLRGFREDRAQRAEASRPQERGAR